MNYGQQYRWRIYKAETQKKMTSVLQIIPHGTDNYLPKNRYIFCVHAVPILIF
jgi:hypothetical protein